jgi:hypothetical protein
MAETAVSRQIPRCFFGKTRPARNGILTSNPKARFRQLLRSNHCYAANLSIGSILCLCLPLGIRGRPIDRLFPIEISPRISPLTASFVPGVIYFVFATKVSNADQRLQACILGAARRVLPPMSAIAAFNPITWSRHLVYPTRADMMTVYLGRVIHRTCS